MIENEPEENREPTPYQRVRAGDSAMAGEWGAPFADAHRNTPGSTLIGRTVGGYLVEARIGGGAMASVYRGVDMRAGRAVALKILLSDADDTVRERFRLEAQMVGTLDHPHIVHTLDVSPTTGADGLTFIAMELVEGQSLADLLERVHTLNVADSCALLAPIARALTYAHSRNVVHRDVKPSNILLRRVAPGAAHAVRLTVLDDPVVPLLSDFGIARALDAPDLTTAGRTIGTPAYMSPEQCAGSREIDGRADIYALGAVLYRCLVGRSPYTGTTTQILYSHVYDPLTIPDDALRLLSPLIVEILRRSMAKNPDDRYAGAAELAADLGVGAGGPGRPSASATDLYAHAPTLQPDPRGDQPDEQTLTYPNLVAAPPREALRVLIPAPTVTPAHLPAAVTPPVVRAASIAQVLTTAAPPARAVGGGTRFIPAAYAKRARQARSTLRGRGVLVGLSLAIPLFMLLALAVGALLDVGPLQFGRSSATPTVALAAPATAVAISDTPQAPIAAAFALSTLPPSATSPAVASPTPAQATPAPSPTVESAAAIAPNSTATRVPAAAPTTDQTPGPTPAGDINAYWLDAQALFAEEEWRDAAAFLTLVQRVNANFEKVSVSEMLYESHLRAALQSLRANDTGAAAGALNQVAALRPEDPITKALAQSAALVVAQPNDATARAALRAALAEESSTRLGSNDPCAAADALEAALAVARSDSPIEVPRGEVDAATEVRGQCTLIQQAKEDEQLLASLAGSLIYSTQLGPQSYRIYRIGAAAGSAPQVVVAEGRQPALSPGGPMLAFHSTRPDVVGIAGFDLYTGGDPSSRSILYTHNAGDAVDSPPSWNGNGERLVFASVDPADQRSRIFTVAADGRATPQGLRPGLSPAWNPVADLIVYNGTDDAGQQPGLWLMAADGSEPTPLTANGADNRPAWSPDGQSVAFMSNGRSSDWDLFRLNLADGIVMQLTTEASQDGLPAISPDGQYVAFVSDWGGNWNIWVKPLAGGRSLLLAPIEGSLTNWLEHALQWIP